MSSGPLFCSAVLLASLLLFSTKTMTTDTSNKPAAIEAPKEERYKDMRRLVRCLEEVEGGQWHHPGGKLCFTHGTWNAYSKLPYIQACNPTVAREVAAELDAGVQESLADVRELRRRVGYLSAAFAAEIGQPTAATIASTACKPCIHSPALIGGGSSDACHDYPFGIRRAGPCCPCWP